jgi:catechol 2,3-dioxygenase-like lactoylglutathione lyase family enzyme
MSADSAQAFAFAVVSVADMTSALELWVNGMGMTVHAQCTGPDRGLAKVWGLQEDAIAEQALLRTPGVRRGGLHLVRFRSPGPVARDNVATTDLLPKSLDVAVVDMHRRYASLAAAGYVFRSPVGAMKAGDMKFFEAHMQAHDGLNVVLLEIEGQNVHTSAAGFGVVPQLVLTTADAQAECAFFQRLLGLHMLSQLRLDGPDVERTIGLPQGAALVVRVLGSPEEHYGRLEFVQYERVTGRNLYSRTTPPARGLLSATYYVDDLAAIMRRGAANLAEHGEVTSLCGTGRMATARSPSGFRVELIEKIS